MSFEFLHSSQNDSTNSAIQADPSAVPARLEADVLVVFFESDGLRGPLSKLMKQQEDFFRSFTNKERLRGNAMSAFHSMFLKDSPANNYL